MPIPGMFRSSVVINSGRAPVPVALTLPNDVAPSTQRGLCERGSGALERGPSAAAHSRHSISFRPTSSNSSSSSHIRASSYPFATNARLLWSAGSKISNPCSHGRSRRTYGTSCVSSAQTSYQFDFIVMARFVELRDRGRYCSPSLRRRRVGLWFRLQRFGCQLARGISSRSALSREPYHAREDRFSTVSRVSMSVNTWAAPSFAIRRSAAALPSICFATCLNSYAVPENARPRHHHRWPPPLMNPPPPCGALKRPLKARGLRRSTGRRPSPPLPPRQPRRPERRPPGRRHRRPHRTAGRAAKAPRMACDSLEEIRIHLMRKNLASPVQVSLRG